MSAYGVGTIYQRNSDKLWVAAVDLPRGRGEKRRRKTRASQTRDDAQLWLEAWCANHPEHYGTTGAGRRANMEVARALGTHTEREWFKYVRALERRCEYCGVQTPRFQQDHKVPVSRGGSDALANLAVACPGCNMEKGTMTADEYVAWKASR